MKSDIELAWLRSTAGERQDFVESYADDLREMLPRYDDHDGAETEELQLAHGQDDGGDDEQPDPAELPCIVDPESTEIGDDDGDFAAEEDFREARRGVARRASGRRVPAAPNCPAEIERMTAEFFARGGQVTKVRPGATGVQPLKPRAPAWRRKIVSSNKGV